MKGKDEAMAIGGHWSPSLDGPNPEKDPSVLIKTAIRCCKALTGIDLSVCTQWLVPIHFSIRNGLLIVYVAVLVNQTFPFPYFIKTGHEGNLKGKKSPFVAKVCLVPKCLGEGALRTNQNTLKF